MHVNKPVATSVPCDFNKKKRQVDIEDVTYIPSVFEVVTYPLIDLMDTSEHSAPVVLVTNEPLTLHEDLFDLI